MKRFSLFITKLQGNPWYALIFIVLAMTSLLMLGYEFSPFARPEVVVYTIRIDLIIAVIFLTDFMLGLCFNTKYSAKDYWRKNWLDFVSSIPVTADAARALRILRMWRALRVLSSALDFYFARKRYNSIKK